jgi:hypothetical protein
VIAANGPQTALVFMPGVQYYTGQVFFLLECVTLLEYVLLLECVQTALVLALHLLALAGLF